MKELLRQFLLAGLIDQSFVTSINPAPQNELSRVQIESNDAGFKSDMEVGP